MILDIEQKICRGCLAAKDLGAFHRDRGGSDGRSSQCKSCAVARAAEWYANNKDHVKQRDARNREAISARACAHRRSISQQCAVAGCGGRASSYREGSLCGKHRERLRIKGGIGAPENIDMRGEANPSWVGDVVTYGGAHARTRRIRGPASQFRCVDCDSPAREWSYNHNGEVELTELVNRKYRTLEMTYSPNVDDYEPRCASCHRIFDGGN